MRILDATAGARSIWYQKNNSHVVYFDKRKGRFNSQSGDKTSQDVRLYKIYPSIVGRWEFLPFIDKCFDMVVFDPPHLIKPKGKKLIGMVACYGILYLDEWKIVLSKAISELFRVLKDDGTFILKWCENDKPIHEVLNLFPYTPMFGSRTGQKNKTHWICFIKHQVNGCIEDYVLNKGVSK